MEMDIVLTETMETRSHESGLATAEYAVATIAAVGFAGLLIAILKSNQVETALGNIISTALSMFSSF